MGAKTPLSSQLEESGLSRVYSLYSTDIHDKFTPVMVRNADGSISTLPNCLHSLVGSTQTLQLDSYTYYDHGHFESFNCLLDGDGCKPFGSFTPPSMPAKDKGVLPIPIPVKRVEAIVRPAYADSDSEETVDSDPHESQLAGDGIGDDGGMR
ncbi:uncharacterized protein LOC110912262 isoform X2 [Helianthus annuus]|uniref:uncharacterized protein LOC110912262 isoform X2 n=1 Tax=Helianthus annuus TaxID=4232 RepID=UPI001652F839|nr:uncharacterized protein LOC110912262 isoform X2 [Helianthus annuus]